MTVNDQTQLPEMQESASPDEHRWALQDLRQAALRQCSWQWLCLPAIAGGMAFTITAGAALVWLVTAAGVLATVHRLLWRHLRLNRSPGSSRLHSRLGLANAITMGRGWAISLLAGFVFLPGLLPTGLTAPLAYCASLVYLLICIADAIDGVWARRTDTESLLGQKLDTEMDALGVLAASTVGVSLNHLPYSYLLVGLSYYAFRYAIRHRENQGKSVRPLSDRPFRRVMSGMTMGFLIAALLPLFPTELLKLAAFYFMLPLLLGFAWDWLDVSGGLSDNATANLLPLLAPLTTIVPVMIRTALLLCGLPVVRHLLLQWPAAAYGWTALWAMMVLGWLGRFAAVAASCLLGIAAERFGYGWIVVVAASCCIYLILSGTGRWSLWKPEDHWIYQQPHRFSRR